MAELVDAAAVSKAFEEHKKYFVDNNETITKKGVRRYLEGQLGLAKGSIDPHKTLISDLCMKLVDEQAHPQDDQENKTHGSASKETPVKKQKKEEKEEPGLAEAAAAEEEEEGASEGLDEAGEASSEEEGDAPEPKKAAKRARKPKEQKEGPGKDSKRRKAAKPAAAKQQTGQGAANSRKVKKLRNMCKAATIPLPPSVFKGQPGEDELCERIETILEKHGLSRFSSAAQVKEVKESLQTQRELDGIDMSNIIQGRPKRGAAVAAVQTVNRYAAAIKKPTAGSDEDDDNVEQGGKEEEGDAEVPAKGREGSDEDADEAEESTEEDGSGRPAAKGGPSQRRGAVICDDSDDGESGGEGEDEDDEDYHEEGAESDAEEEEEAGGESEDED